ncbi:uncharacterized protein LOC112588500 [Harpegnathos saltator]|uniref:uncharacterized protein LOC112588499 n=1 Tax=Harpegnathos saltator TaxID=610380 RepID=UPI000DBEDFD9|nr:uncharacterized protein LOC112588499 [Harpegnathos saltator]XP_025154455.1 uncharacterized protein LOC112588500 [Harpegnathos saltator]
MGYIRIDDTTSELLSVARKQRASYDKLRQHGRATNNTTDLNAVTARSTSEQRVARKRRVRDGENNRGSANNERRKRERCNDESSARHVSSFIDNEASEHEEEEEDNETSHTDESSCEDETDARRCDGDDDGNMRLRDNCKSFSPNATTSTTPTM